MYRRCRSNKGESIKTHVDDYCVLDLETTGIFVNSADIIEIGALRVRDNVVVAEFSTLINPQCHIPGGATAVNHITDEMVKDAPCLESVIDDFLEFVGNDVIVGYNNASFDMNLVYDAVENMGKKPFDNDYLDILYAVRRTLPELDNSRLETVSKYYGFDTEGEHRALKDCYLTKRCYDKMYEDFGDTAFYGKYQAKSCSRASKDKYISSAGIQYTSETLAMRELQQLLEGMLSDGKISEEEVLLLSCWVEEHRDLSGNYPFDKAYSALDRVLEDGVITGQELLDLKTIFTEIVDPVKAQGCHEKICSLNGKHVCLTGNFDYGPKSEVEKLIVSAGGIIDKSVKKATDFVIVGAQGSEAWKTGNYGGKIQKAIEWNEKGMDIKIVEEGEFISEVRELV